MSATVQGQTEKEWEKLKYPSEYTYKNKTNTLDLSRGEYLLFRPKHLHMKKLGYVEVFLTRTPHNHKVVCRVSWG